MSDERPIQRRTFLKASGAAAATVTLAGCSSGDNEEEELPEEFEVSITQGNMPSGLDPHDHRETPTDVVMLHAYEGVLTRDADGQTQNRLATEYERIEDGHARFTIREDVQFHNGDDLTPADVAFTINRIVDEEVGFASPQNDQLAGVTGAEVADEGRAVDVFSEGLNPTVFSSFATYCDVMQQSWAEEREKAEIGQNMMGTGPFELESYTEDQEVILTRNEEYWDDLPEVSEVSFTAASESSTRVNQLLNGETDITVNVPPQEVSRVENSDNANVEAAPSTRIIYNAMRYDVEPFSDPDFRRAMNYAIDLESIVSNVLEGFGDQTGQPTLEGFVGHNSDIDPYPHEPETAEQLIEDSGNAGAEIELHTPNGRYLKDFEIAQAVVGYIDDLDNVSASVNQRDFGSLVDDLLTGEIEDKPPWYLIGWGEATFDGGLVMTALLTTDGALSSYSDDEVDQMMAEAANQSGDEREGTLKEVNQLIHERAPWIFLNRQYSVYGASDRIDWDARSDERIDASEIAQP